MANDPIDTCLMTDAVFTRTVSFFADSIVSINGRCVPVVSIVAMQAMVFNLVKFDDDDVDNGEN